ncbi:MAG: Stk1 family PASTA domain-containing Ser/Thr kinase [Clostridiales bacterium]|jgi:serine/threonine-protein kinase|nr:Stk1 family PASTA domain-containing Ser/Thr kinase [Eubacteriales bacterium]MDH7566618.1 Stk1 family PASTA domain-containing Ser/Thr kinase [Clostridiales bacterium]
MVGQILGNRYELIEKIGGGGMALVYKAKCNLLNRYVAVKVLRPEFTSDEEFVKRFRIEAQAAASLSHPNIVSIYDVGQEDGMHYLVMELIDGITLKKYIAEKGRLNWREAVNIAIQICSALEHAHRNHIIHRDIKPHNILLTREGIAKVTDFGIARAVSSSTITMVGSTIGSVHYFSPEQARGGFTDEKSDLYSLGICLYEMVTGRLPFDGETPVAVALQHIQVEPKQPRDIQDDIPKGINDIIVTAMKKEQGQRYQSAAEMLQDLYRVLREPDGDFSAADSETYPTKRVMAINSENAVKGQGSTGRKDEYLIREDEKEPGEKKKRDKRTILLAAVTSLVLISLCVFLGYSFVVPSTKQEPDFTVGNYVGRNIDEVKEELKNAGIQVKETRKPDETVLKDFIISQRPEPGKTLKPGGYAAVELDVSDGPELLTMEDLSKIDYKIAEKRIQDMGLVPKVESEFSDTIGIDLVTRTVPAAKETVKPGSIVTIYKSKGPELKPTKVPDLVGSTSDEAKRLLADAKLKLGKIYPEDGKNYVDKIIDQDPKPQTEVMEDTAVNIYFESSDGQRKSVKTPINLVNPESYGDKIKVLVEFTPSDTKKTEQLVNKVISKEEFPIILTVPVPDKGKTDVTVYLDNVFYKSFPVQ